MGRRRGMCPMVTEISCTSIACKTCRLQGNVFATHLPCNAELCKNCCNKITSNDYVICKFHVNQQTWPQPHLVLKPELLEAFTHKVHCTHCTPNTIRYSSVNILALDRKTNGPRRSWFQVTGPCTKQTNYTGEM